MGFFSKIFKSPIFKAVAPLALDYFVPGLGGAIGGALGATTAAGAQGLGGAVLGGGLGALGGGGLKGAAMGAIPGGIGGYVQGAGGLGQAAQSLGLGNLGTPLTTNGIAGGVGNYVSGSGSGLAGMIGSAGNAIGNASNGLSSFLGGGGSSAPAGGGSSVFGNNSLGNVANIGSALLGVNGANQRANMLNAGNNQALAAQTAMYNQTQGNLNPFIQSGTGANTMLSNQLGTSGNTGTAGYGSLTSPFTASDFTADPGYQFRLQQGQQALDRSLAAQGQTFSGGAMKAAQDYGQGLANQTYNDAFNRNLQQKQATYGMLSGQAGQGQQAAGQLGAIGAGYAGNMANLYGNQGNINAQGNQAAQNAINYSLSNIMGGNFGGLNRPQNYLGGY